MATIKQQKAFSIAVENGGNVSLAMRKAKYSPKTAKTPKKLTESKGWEDLLNENMSERALMRAGKEGLKSTLIKFTPEGDQLKVPDYNARHKYFESGLKLRGRLQNNEPLGNTTNILNVFTGEQIRRAATRYIETDSGSEEPSDRLPNSNESTV